MKTVIKLAITAVIFLGCFNVASALPDEYRFEDKVHDALLFDARMTDQEIVKMVLDTAADYDIPITANGIEIGQKGPDVVVSMTYTTDVQIIPGVFSWPWTFTPSASTKILVGRRR
jgi:hypothetical protein